MSGYIPFDANVQGRPACWDWTNHNIVDYITTRRGVALAAYQNEGHSIHGFNDMLNLVLLPCLTRYDTYAYKSDGITLQECKVSFHLRDNIPIADVYSALGWFISYAEIPTKDLLGNQIRHVCFTRLCYQIAADVKRNLKTKSYSPKATFYPKKTHMLLVGTFPFLTTEAGTTPLQGIPDVSISFSASLPYDAADRSSTARAGSKGARLDTLNAINGTPSMRSVTAGMTQLEPNFAGNCAETLNFASQYSTDPNTITVGFGQSLDVKKVGGSFKSMQEHLSEAHTDPCRSCRHLFTGGSVTQQDLGSGMIWGPIPDNYRLQENWAARNEVRPCAFCYRRLDQTSAYMQKWCNANCYDSYVMRSQASTGWPPNPAQTNWVHQGQASGAGPSQRPRAPAIAGYPYPPITGYYNMAENHEFNNNYFH